MGKNKVWWLSFAIFLVSAAAASAGEADINIPDLSVVQFFNGSLSGHAILWAGLVICVVGVIFGLVQYTQTKALPVHKRMGDVSNIIWETCKTYLTQQGRFLVILWVLIAFCMGYYFLGLQEPATPVGNVVVILLCSILGILGSYGVA